MKSTTGKITFKESLTLTPGAGPTVVDTDAGRLGIGICYDIRFPELAQIYAQRGCQALVYPGALCVGCGAAEEPEFFTADLLLRATAPASGWMYSRNGLARLYALRCMAVLVLVGAAAAVCRPACPGSRPGSLEGDWGAGGRPGRGARITAQRSQPGLPRTRPGPAPLAQAPST